MRKKTGPNTKPFCTPLYFNPFTALPINNINNPLLSPTTNP